MKAKLLNALVIALMLFQAVAPMGVLAYTSTDQADYAPGSVVTIFGDNSDSAGYLPGETVHVDVAGPNGYTAACDATVSDDPAANGAWSCQVTLWESLDAVGPYEYTATGLTSGVSQTAIFSDAAKNIQFFSNLPDTVTWCVTLTQSSVNTQKCAAGTVTFGSTVGSYTYTVDSPISGTTGVRYIASPTSGTAASGDNVTINFTTQYQVSFAVSPSGGGSVNPSLTNWYDAGFVINPLAATPALGYVFSTWSNGGASIVFASSSSASTTATINGTGVIAANFATANHAPVATNDSYSTPEDTPLTIAAPGVLGNDTDADGDTLAAGKVTEPANGSVTLGSDGSFTYTPNANFTGLDSFTYKANDGKADSNVATVTITVTAVNDVPVAAADAYSTAEDTPLTIPASGVLTNDSDVDSSTLLAVKVTDPTYGTVSLNADGSFTYSPNLNFNGTDSFTYKVSDGTADSNVAIVTITVTPVNDLPVAGDDTYSTNEDTMLNVVAAQGVLSNDNDVDGDPLSAELVGGPSYGSLTLNADGSFDYTPNANFNGSDSFTYKVKAGIDYSNIATVSLTVNAVNDAPVLNSIGNKTVDEETLLSFTATATDIEADTLTFSLVNEPAGASITSGGNFSWTPTETQGPSDYTFTVQVCDNGTPSECDSESITVHVNEVNVAPVLNAIGNKNIDEETLLSFTATATDHDIPAQTLSFSLMNAPTGASITSDGALTWTPTEAQGPGTYSFGVCVSDGVSSDCETIEVTVNEVNLAPVLGSIGNQAVDEETLLSFTATATDADLPANALTFSLVSAPAGASMTSGGAFTWTPGESQGPGTYTFDVCVSDGALHDCETIEVAVNEVNLAPVLDSIGNKSVNEGSLLSFTATASDADVPANSLSFSLVGAPAGASMTSGGAFSWTPADNGSFSFKVKVCDNGSPFLCDEESITVTVNNVAPTVTKAVFSSQVQACGANSVLTINFTDPGADTYTVDIDWGDGSTHTTGAITDGQSFNHSYGTGGPYTARIVVTDDDQGDSVQFSSTNTSYGGYKIDSILQPINMTGSRSLFKYGSVIPVKLQLKDCAGNLVGNQTVYIRLQKLSGDTPSGTDEGLVSAGSANTDNIFRYDATAQQYIYNLSTKNLTSDSTSSWRIFVDVLLAPSVIQSNVIYADFGLKK